MSRLGRSSLIHGLASGSCFLCLMAPRGSIMAAVRRTVSFFGLDVVGPQGFRSVMGLIGSLAQETAVRSFTRRVHVKGDCLPPTLSALGRRASAGSSIYGVNRGLESVSPA